MTNLAGYSQNEVLTQRLAGKTKFKDIIAEVDTYYRRILGNEINAEPGNNLFNKEKEYKHWKRWEWFHSARLNPDGTLANASAKLLEALNMTPNNTYPGQINSSSLTNSGAWTVVGPSATIAGANAGYRGLGRCDRIAFHPTDPLTYYVGTPAGGLWRTSNDGASWVNLTDGLPSMGISGIVVSHADPNTIYILTGDGDSNVQGLVESFGYMRFSQGVFKSIDGGASWQQAGAFPPGALQYTAYKLVQSPTNANVLIAATSRGLFRTINGGQTWENAVPDEPAAVYHDVEFKPGSGTVAYAVAKFGNGSFFFRTSGSINLNFYSTGSGLPGGGGNNIVSRYAIGVTNANAGHVVLIAGPSTDSTGFQGIYRSLNEGYDFTQVLNTPNILGNATNGLSSGDQSSYDLCIAVAHNNFQKIITGGLCIWRTTIGAGTNTEAITKFHENTVGSMPYIHPDVHDVSYNPINNFLYACTDGGIYKSTDNGTTWTDISAGMIISQYYHLAGTPADATKYLGGLQDNGTLYRKTPSATFTQIAGADGFHSAISSVNTNTIYFTANKNIYRSLDGGTTIAYIIPVTGNVFFPSLRLNPSNQSKVYLGTGHALSAGGAQKHVFYRSDNGGTTYIDSTTIDLTRDIVCAPSDVNVLYGTNGFNIWRSQNEGFSFQLRNNGLPAARAIRSLAVDPNNSSVVVATLGGFTAGQKLYYTSDAGLNWQNLSGSLPNVPVTCAAVNTNGDVYIGTDIGVFYQANVEVDWRPFYNGLPRVPITELVLYPTNDLIVAATFGRGIWQTTLYTSCPASVSYAVPVNTPRVYNAGTEIFTTQNITGTTGVNVLFKAGNKVVMNPGFRANSGSVMNAIIGPCDPGLNAASELRGIKVPGGIVVPPLPPEATQKTGLKQVYE